MTRKNGNAATTTHYSNVLTYLCPENCRTTDCASEWLQTITSEQIKNQNVSNEWVAAMCSLGPRKLQSTNRHKVHWTSSNPYSRTPGTPTETKWLYHHRSPGLELIHGSAHGFKVGLKLLTQRFGSMEGATHLKSRCSFLQLEWANIFPQLTLPSQSNPNFAVQHVPQLFLKKYLKSSSS